MYKDPGRNLLFFSDYGLVLMSDEAFGFFMQNSHKKKHSRRVDRVIFLT